MENIDESQSNEQCVGPASEMAGKAASCAGCPNAQLCASAPKGPDPDVAEIAKKLRHVKKKVLVLSGKGGVGKSTVSCHLAYALAARDLEVGLVDIDICGPSVPKMMGLEGESIHQHNLGWSPVYVEDNLGVMSIGFFLASPDEPVVWRGDKKTGFIKKFLKEVYWGDKLDILLVDAPPGTSDEHLAVVQSMKDAGIDGAIIVTTPQEVAMLDVRKEITFCAKVNVPVLGVVENMAGFVCPNCKGESTIFRPSTGGARAMCEEMKVPFLGSLPLDPMLGRACDQGLDYFNEEDANDASSKAFSVVVDNLVDRLSSD